MGMFFLGIAACLGVQVLFFVLFSLFAVNESIFGDSDEQFDASRDQAVEKSAFGRFQDQHS